MIRELLREADRYLAGQITAQDLESWLLSRLQRILDSGDQPAIELANALDADLVELSEGILTEGQIRQRLSNAVETNYTVRLVDPNIQEVTVTSADSQPYWGCFQDTLVTDFRAVVALG